MYIRLMKIINYFNEYIVIFSWNSKEQIELAQESSLINSMTCMSIFYHAYFVQIINARDNDSVEN